MTDTCTFPATQRIGILVFDGFEPIDVFGFVEAFAIARFLGTDYPSPPPYPFEIVLIAGKIAKVKSANGPSVMPDLDFAQALAQPLDLLMVPGGGGTWPLLDETAHPQSVAKLLDWMRAMDKKVRIMARSAPGPRFWQNAVSWMACRPRPTMPPSAGWPSTAPACCGTASRAGSMPANTSPPRASRPAPTSAFTWCRGSPAGRSPKQPRSRPNTTGIATRRHRFSIRSKPAWGDAEPCARGKNAPARQAKVSSRCGSGSCERASALIAARSKSLIRLVGAPGLEPGTR
jgi:hypothetical protein